MGSLFDDLANIDTSKDSWKILVKVVRLWSTRRFNGCKIPHAVELVLMDSKGAKIQATIRKTLVYKFQHLIKEGGVYSISFLAPVVNSGDYKTTKHQYEVNFLYNIEVHPINVSPFLFVPVRSILNQSVDVNYLVDVLGILTGVGNEKSYESDRDNIKMNVIEIDSDGAKIECALFGEYVDELNRYLGSGDICNTAVVIQLAKVKTFRGKVCLQNS